MCSAEKGSSIATDMAMTDISLEAGWRSTLFSEEPWERRPPLMNMPGFMIQMVGIDLMHAFHLGVCRDLMGSALKVLIRGKYIFPGSTIDKRLQAASQSLRAYASQNKLQLRLKKITKANLHWEGQTFPEIRCKASDSAVILKWLSWVFRNHALPENLAHIGTVLWAANEWISCIMSSGDYISDAQREHCLVIGDLFLETYLVLASEAYSLSRWLWRVRPKFHLLCHVQIYIQQTRSKRNIRTFATWMDEDFIKKVMRIRKSTHVKTSALRTLQRYLETLLAKFNSLASSEHDL